MNEILSLQDYVFGGMYFIGLLFFCYFFGGRRNAERSQRKYFFWALFIRLFSALFYIFLYKEIIKSVTDTGRYYYQGLIIRDTILNGSFAMAGIDWGDSTAITSILCGLVALLTPGNYLSISFIFTVFGFIGSWKIYSIFVKLYPELAKQLAMVILFLPSVFFWGSGLLKDPIALLGLGFMFSGASQIFIFRSKMKRGLFSFLLGLAISALIKIYIPLIFLPCFFLFIGFRLLQKIKLRATKIILYPVLATAIGFGIYFVITKLPEFNTAYKADQVGEGIRKMQEYYEKNPETIGGSAYDIGMLSPNLLENIKLMPAAFMVTFFRPFLWEVRSILYIPSVYESLLVYFLLLKIIFQRGVFTSIKNLIHDPFLRFCFLFSLFFGITVGLSSFNFGTLMRYKIPCLPFWYALLIILAYSKKINPQKTET